MFIYGGIIIWLFIAVGRFLGHGGGPAWASTADFIGITHTRVYSFCFSSVFFPVDLLTGFGSFFPHIAPRLRGWALLGGCVLTIVATIQGIRSPIVTSYEVQLNELPRDLDGTTLVALSDLHLGSFSAAVA